MNKSEFLDALEARLMGLPVHEVRERIAFYGEMIDDRTEEGISEDEAVAAIGSIDEVAEQIVADIPLSAVVKEKTKKKRRMRGWEIALLALGAPVWVSLLIAAFAVVISVYASLWAVVISLWSAMASFAACVLGGIVGGICFAIGGNGYTGMLMIGAAFVCAGLAVFTFFGCKAATKGVVKLPSKIALVIKLCFVKKEGV